MAAAPATPPAGGFMSRHPFMSGLMGGILGAGLFGMMFGGGFGGAAGMLGMLLQVLLIGGVAYLAVRLFRGWSAARVQPAGPARAYATAPGMTDAPMEQPLARSAGPLLVGGASAQLAITTEDYTAFETLLSEIQTATATAISPGCAASRRRRCWATSRNSFPATQAAGREQGRGGEARAG